MIRIQPSVNVVFLKQLTHWMLYAKIVDTYGEFFIQPAECKDNSTVDSEKGASMGSGRYTNTTFSVSKYLVLVNHFISIIFFIYLFVIYFYSFLAYKFL